MPLNTKIPQQIVSSTTTALSVKRGDAAMLVADLDKGAIVLMDGKTYGGIPMAREDVQIRAGSDAITVNGKEWAPLLGNVNIDINPSGFIENVVSPTDKVLGVGVDGKIAAQLSVAYDETSGLFSLKGKDGETISSFTLVIPTGITPKSVALVENPESQEPGLYLEFVFIDDDDVEIKLYANMDALKDVYTAGRGITISDDRVISVDEAAISGVIADDLIEENSGLKVENEKLHLDGHASETPEYGLGDEDKYGHVRLADSGDSRATVQAGIAATPAAVKDVDDRTVHNEGDETISGVKTFVDTPKVTLPDGGTDNVATLTDVEAAVVAVEHPIATFETPGVVQPDGITTKVDSVGVLSAIGGNLQWNDEIWITESGNFEVPYDGLYEVFVIGGGTSGSCSAANLATAYAAWANGGQSGAFDTTSMHLTAGAVIPVTIGAGGVPLLDAGGYASVGGGVTSFGDFTPTNSNKRMFGIQSPQLYNGSGSVRVLHGVGGGVGTGSSWNALEYNNARYWGAGGSAAWQPGVAYAGNGYQGVVRLRFWNPTKAAGPVE